MDFIDKIRELSARIPKQLEHIQTEEATKNALVLPFISALGYNVFDPTEVTPELNADVGIKKGEKVDYAILIEGQPLVLFECKHHGKNLAKAHGSQLYRYFSVTQARFGVLTNGIVYQFYSDLESPNKMDDKPFFVFDMLNYKERHVEELKKFSKSAFDLNNILTTASELKYTRALKQLVAEEMQEPSEDFVKFFASRVYSGKLTKPVREQFTDITKRALQQYINERINQRLEFALADEQPLLTYEDKSSDGDASEEANVDSKPVVVTTDEEVEAFYIVKSIMRDVVNPERIVMRDVQSYCSVLLDDNNRKPICRFRFNGSQKYLGLIDDNKSEEKQPITNLDEIYQFADRLRETLMFYE